MLLLTAAMYVFYGLDDAPKIHSFYSAQGEVRALCWLTSM